MSYSHPQSPFNRSKGMTLVEVLIAAVIIGIGLLGIASLQVTALQGASNADYRSRAIDLSASLADRMRANRLGVAANSYSDANANATADCAAPPATVCAMTPSASAAPAQCTTLDMASFDLWEIRCRNGVQNSLPGGQMTIACTNTSGTGACLPLSPMVVTISWQMQTNEATAETQRVVTTIIPGAP